jgi:porin
VQPNIVLLTKIKLGQDRQWLLGDWNGQRQQLEKDGYKFTAAIMSQSATNLDGGYNDDNALKMQRNYL